MKKVYLATSWRNERFYNIKATLEAKSGVEVYDFRLNGFKWKEADYDEVKKDVSDYLDCMKNSPVAHRGFDRDMYNLNTADACVLLLPCGRSAHLEMGYAAGRGTPCAVLLSYKDFEPELMYNMADLITLDVFAVCEWLKSIKEA